MPFLNPETPAEECYNKAQILTHICVDCCFGILKNRFRSLLISLWVFGPLRSSKVITAMLVLHNIAIMNRDFFEPLPPGEILQPGKQERDNDTVAGTNTRRHYVEAYFSWILCRTNLLTSKVITCIVQVRQCLWTQLQSFVQLHDFEL